jgi:hypothetical protein
MTEKKCPMSEWRSLTTAGNQPQGDCLEKGCGFWTKSFLKTEDGSGYWEEGCSLVLIAKGGKLD